MISSRPRILLLLFDADGSVFVEWQSEETTLVGAVSVGLNVLLAKCWRGDEKLGKMMELGFGKG